MSSLFCYESSRWCMQIPATCQGWSLSHINSASTFIPAKNHRRSNEITTHRQSYRNTQSHVIFLYRDLKYVLTSQLDILLSKIVREHISGHCVKHDYVLYVMGKTAHFLYFNIHAYFVSNIILCHQHYRELVQYPKMHIPDLQSAKQLYTGTLCLKEVTAPSQRQQSLWG